MKILQVAEATQALKDGHVVAIPTETVYGLAANATLARTLRKIYEIKNRPLQNPLICHCRDTEEISQYAFLSPLAHKLFPLWPGPLTLVLPSKRLLPKEVNNGSDWLAFRIPNHPLSLRILQALPFPLAMPSANLSGRESPTSVGMVRDQLADRIYGAVAGHCQAGIESTIVQVLPDHVRLLRLGALPLEKIQQSIGTAKIETQHNGQSGKNPAPSSQQLVAPGSRYKHYAPKAPLLLLSDSAITTTQLFKEQASRGKIFRSLYLDKTKDNEAKKTPANTKGTIEAIETIETIEDVLDTWLQKNPQLTRRIGYISFGGDTPAAGFVGETTVLFSLSDSGDFTQAAQGLYRAFYLLACRMRCSLLVMRNFRDHPLGQTLNDRLIRAATWYAVEQNYS